MPTYPVGRASRSSHYEDNLEWFSSTRAAALTVPCRDCHAVIGDRCVNGCGGLLEKFPAHPCRVEAARAVASPHSTPIRAGDGE